MCDVIARPVRPRCGSWACSSCGDRKGQAYQAKLLERVAFRAATHVWSMVTLTLDPKLFGDSPTEALGFVKRNHVVSRTVNRWYRSKGFDPHGAWFAKMELQRSGMPHWHVLIETPRERVDAETGEVLPVVLRLPSPEDPVADFFGCYGDGSAPAGVWKWGRSKVNVSEGASPLTAVQYMTKYACKEAAGEEGCSTLERSGLPAKGIHWVHASRGFWSVAGLSEPVEDDDGFCVGNDEEDLKCFDDLPMVTLAERVETCARCSVLRIEVVGSGYAIDSPMLPCSRSVLANGLSTMGAVVEEFERRPESKSQASVVKAIAMDVEALRQVARSFASPGFDDFVAEVTEVVSYGGIGGERGIRVAEEVARWKAAARALEASSEGWSEREAMWREALPPGEVLPRPWEGGGAGCGGSEVRIGGGGGSSVSVGGGEKASGSPEGGNEPSGRSR